MEPQQVGLTKGVKYFHSLLQMDFEIINDGLELEAQAVSLKVEQARESAREEKRKELAQVIARIDGGKVLEAVLKQPEAKQRVEEIAKQARLEEEKESKQKASDEMATKEKKQKATQSLRKTEAYGYICPDLSTVFEWPTKEEIEKASINKDLRVASINFWKSS